MSIVLLPAVSVVSTCLGSSGGFSLFLVLVTTEAFCTANPGGHDDMRYS